MIIIVQREKKPQYSNLKLMDHNATEFARSLTQGSSQYEGTKEKRPITISSIICSFICQIFTQKSGSEDEDYDSIMDLQYI